MKDDGHHYCEGGGAFELAADYEAEWRKGVARYDLRELGPPPEREPPCECRTCRLVRSLFRRERKREER